MSIIKLTGQSKFCVNLRNLCGVVSLLTLVSCSNTADKQEVDSMIADVKKIAVTASDVASQQWYDSTKKLNHLAGESSPYLLSHADNPVNWYPWGDEALQKAKSENKPIFLSVGYASCHWCHVMEHESFEDDSVAAYLNEHYIAIKVDREQRPDIDQIYMTAVSVFSGSGGWPMSVFLTPDLKPFFAGTYYPREDNPTYGLPGFLTLLKRLNDVYVNHRDKLDEQAEALTKAVKARLAPEFEKAKLSHEIFDSAIAQSVQSMDSAYGGFGTGQKFPHSTELKALIRYVAMTDDSDVKALLTKSLDALIRFGMYDQVGGGFHRYTVDRQFAVPHFEKMLYDNALLASVLIDATLVYDNEEYRDAAIATVDFMLREMTSPEGALYSALDADSEGHEGKFYVWTKAEIDAALGDDAEFYYRYYNVTDIGNFELNTNVLARKPGAWQNLIASSDRESVINRIDGINAQLLRKRSERQRPLTDDKVIAAWNGMALTAICNVYQLTGDERYLSAATKLGEFLTSKMLSGDTLHHTYRNGTISVGVYLEDYAYVSNGLVDLYESSGEYKWLEFANTLVTTGFEKFADDKGGLYMSQANDKSSLARPRDFFDSSYPAPGSFLMLAAQRLSALTDNRELSGRVAKSLDALSGIMKEAPVALMSAVLVYHNQVIPRAEFAVIGTKASRDPFLRVAFTTYAPNRVIAFSDKADERVALLAGKKATDSATGYVCRNYACKLPSETPEDFAKQIAGLTYAIAD